MESQGQDQGENTVHWKVQETSHSVAQDDEKPKAPEEKKGGKET